MKRGRPTVDPAKVDEALRLRAEGVPWSELEVRLRVSRRTLLRKSGHGEHGQNSPEGDGRGGT
jgi:hypothetical protein